jgi:hypothetical protein
MVAEQDQGDGERSEDAAAGYRHLALDDNYLAQADKRGALTVVN